MNPKIHFLQLLNDLFTRGEMLKAENLLDLVPLDYIDDPDIGRVKLEIKGRLDELRKWNKEGRPFSENHANINDFPKFELAIQKIREMKDVKRVLDIGLDEELPKLIEIVKQNRDKIKKEVIMPKHSWK